MHCGLCALLSVCIVDQVCNWNRELGNMLSASGLCSDLCLSCSVKCVNICSLQCAVCIEQFVKNVKKRHLSVAPFSTT